MKRSSKITISLIIFILFLINVFLFSLYLFRTDSGIVSNLKISLGDNKKPGSVDLTPITDEEGSKLEPYIFKITNNGRINSSYKVVFKDSNDNHKKEQLLDRKLLRYQLKLNGKVLITDNLYNIKNNVLDSKTIKSGVTNTYEFRVWIDKSVMESDWMDKYYNYSISIQSVDNR